MTRDDLTEAFEHELTDDVDPYEPDHTWTNACQRPVGKGMTMAARVAAACALAAVVIFVAEAVMS